MELREMKMELGIFKPSEPSHNKF